MESYDELIDFLRITKPTTVLDLGIGNGFVGALTRTVLDLAEGRNERGDWETIIVGVPLKDKPTFLDEAYTFIDKYEDFNDFDFKNMGGFDLVFISQDVWPQEVIDYLRKVNRDVLEVI